ncbi:hypothetical protein BDD12DRAFT_814347 [Trichophaea hybrida]|nr:hypothetical protein BDD12DRAFT_814347 [Trichophaea hybrida]
MRFTHLLSAVLALGLSLAQDPDGGTHSDKFDKHKYTLLDQLLITPKTHPHLFSFTGRWLRTPTAHPHAPAYHATLWPGNSVTVLIFGDKASIKLLPLPQGVVEHYSFAVSIDGSPDIRYNTNRLDTSLSKVEGHYIALEFAPTKDPSPNEEKVLEPHAVRITSIPSTPFSFEGLFVQNTQISQGLAWEESQAHRPVLEFIGEGIDAERPGGFFRTDKYDAPPGETVESPIDAIFSTVHYKFGEHLGVRHSHMSAGTCLIPNCDSRNLPGLETQYFSMSPLDHTGHTPDIQNKNDPRHQENLQSPYRFDSSTMRTNVVSHVIVDVGILDMVMKEQSPDTYTHALARFLTRIRLQSHPKAKILVIGHHGASHPDATILKKDPTTSAKRKALFSATKNAVGLVRDPNTHFTPVKIDRGDPQKAYLKSLCPYIRPSVIARTKGFFRQKTATKAQLVCAEIIKGETKWGSGNVVVFVGLVIVGLVLWMARSTVVGAIAAVLGRRRMGMPEEEGMMLERK